MECDQLSSSAAKRNRLSLPESASSGLSAGPSTSKASELPCEAAHGVFRFITFRKGALNQIASLQLVWMTGMMPPGHSATPVLESLTFYVQINFTEAKIRESFKSLGLQGYASRRTQALRCRWARPGAACQWVRPAQLRINLALWLRACARRDLAPPRRLEPGRGPGHIAQGHSLGQSCTI